MGGIKLSVHPLFFAIGIFYAGTGRIFEFAVYTVTAVIHELGHSLVASKSGYRLNRIVLMPFGAVVKGNIDGLKFSDEVKIALAGPLINLTVGFFFLALWWIVPEIYAFTDLCVQANFATALVNLLPAFPLDGGRVLSAMLSIKLGSGKAFKISKALGITFGLSLFGLFVLSVFYTANLSLLIFSLFVISGVLTRTKDNVYIKAYSAVTAEKLMRGMPFKKQGIEKRATVKKLISILDEQAINEIAVFDGNRQVATLTQEKIGKIIENGELYSPIEKYIN